MSNTSTKFNLGDTVTDGKLTGVIFGIDIREGAENIYYFRTKNSGTPRVGRSESLLQLSKVDKIATAIIDRMFDVGLASSTFRANNPHAYEELLSYKQDMYDGIRTVLIAQEIV